MQTNSTDVLDSENTAPGKVDYFLCINFLTVGSTPKVITDPVQYCRDQKSTSQSYQFIPLQVASVAVEMLAMLKKIVDGGLSYREFLPEAQTIIDNAEKE